MKKNNEVVLIFILAALIPLSMFVSWLNREKYPPLTPAQAKMAIDPNFDVSAGQYIYNNDGVYPNQNYTTGKYDTLDPADLTKLYNGKTYSQSHRNVPDSEKKQVYAEYSVTYPGLKGQFEVDHFYPVCAGGSNDISNLWLEPSYVVVNGVDLGFHTKDKLEAWACAQIKKGLLDPVVLWQGITKDWVEFYKLHQSEIEKVKVTTLVD